MTRLSYHGDPKFKADLIAAAIQHRKNDDYVAGIYHAEQESFFRGQASRFRGCSIGCAIHDVKKLRGVEIGSYGDHEALAEALGFPEWLVNLQDQFYESLEGDEQRRWTERFFEAIPDGVDLEHLGYELAARCLDRCLGYIGEGSESWRVDCRRVVSDSAAILRTGRWLTAAEAPLPQVEVAAEASRAGWAAWKARASEASHADWAVWAKRAAQAAAAEWAAKAAAAWEECATWAVQAVQAAEDAECKAQRDDLFELLAEADKEKGDE